MPRKSDKTTTTQTVAASPAASTARQRKTTKQPVQQATTTPVQTEQSEQSTRRAGRTLLVKGQSLSTSLFEGLQGLVNQAETKTTNSVFLTFDTSPNALNALRKLRTENQDLRVKFSHYRIFFTLTGLTDTSDYNQVKQDLIQHVESKSGSQVLFLKLYRKDNHYMGCGDMTVDTLSGMTALLSKDGGNKEFTIGNLSGTFYRYNANKGQTQEASA